MASPYPMGDLHLLFFASFPGALRLGSKPDMWPKLPPVGSGPESRHQDRWQLSLVRAQPVYTLSAISVATLSLDDYVTEDNPVRAVDVFVDGLDLEKLGFVGVQPLDTGRPSLGFSHSLGHFRTHAPQQTSLRLGDRES